MNIQTVCAHKESFVSRHIGSGEPAQEAALQTVATGAVWALMSFSGELLPC